MHVNRDSGDEFSDNWVAAIPHVLIEDGIVTRCCEEDHYHFNTEAKTDIHGFDIIDRVSSDLISFFSNYFLLIVLGTLPLLAFTIKMVHRKENVPLINHLIFTLHYTALIEGVILLLYILHLIAKPSGQVMKWLVIISTNLYLTIAYKEVYSRNSWIKSAIKSLITNAVYSMILIITFFIIFCVACCIAAASF